LQKDTLRKSARQRGIGYREMPPYPFEIRLTYGHVAT
jgi:hypothetical protein